MNTIRRSPRMRRGGVRGQSMIIFGLASVVLFGVCGLAIDSGVSYLSANKVERAAGAGALAGVTYMPADAAGAFAAARAAVKRNGYVDDAGVTTKVVVYPVPLGCTSNCSPTRLGVGISTLVSNTFTKVLGFGPTHWVRQDATAEYLPTLTLGQPGAQQGSTAQQLSSSGCCYLLRNEGWATDRGQGDAYTPNPADPGNTSLASSDMHGLSANSAGTDFTTITGYNNCPARLTCSTPKALPAQGGYNYQIDVPSTVANATVMVYNPAFAPNKSAAYGPQDYHEADSINPTNHAQYSVMEYTLFEVTDRFNHLNDVPVAQVKVSPIDAATDPSTSTNAITGGTLSGAVQTGASIYQNWVNIFNPPDVGLDSKGYQLINFTGGGRVIQLAAGKTYRLRIDTLDDLGGNPGPGSATQSAAHKGYALQVALGGSANTLCTSCTLGALNELAVYTPMFVQPPQTSAQFPIPLVDVPPQYAGLTVNFYVYDPGDLSQNSNLLSIADPDTGLPAVPGASQGGAVPIFNLGPSRATLPSGANAITASPERVDANATIQTIFTGGSCVRSHDCYDGHWLLYKVVIPTGYCGCGARGEFWSLNYAVTGAGRANDTFTMAVGFDGPPVHLIPNP